MSTSTCMHIYRKRAHTDTHASMTFGRWKVSLGLMRDAAAEANGTRESFGNAALMLFDDSQLCFKLKCFRFLLIKCWEWKKISCLNKQFFFSCWFCSLDVPVAVQLVNCSLMPLMITRPSRPPSTLSSIEYCHVPGAPSTLPL